MAKQARAERRERRAAHVDSRRAQEQRRRRIDEERRRDPQPWLVPVLAGAFLVSGAAGLVHEVVWTRLLGHLFGVTSYAISTVLGAYMGGLALGSAWLGRRAERLRDPLRTYVWLEIGIGAFALAVPSLLHVVEPLYGWLWRELRLSFAVFSAIRLVLAGSILLVPTFLMGATLPALAEALARREGRRLTPQWLYTMNLAGAVVGAALAGFGLMPLAGVFGTIVTGALLNFAAAVVATAPTRADASTVGAAAVEGDAAPRDAAEAGAATREGARPAAPRRAGATDADAVGAAAALLACAFASGLLSLATQVAWNRVLVLVVGSTNYAFTSVLLVYLVALGLGGALASRAGDRAELRGDVAAWARSRLPIAFLACAGLTAPAVALAGSLPQLYHSLYGVSDARSLAGLVFRSVVSTGLVVFPPVLAAGTILPLTLIAAGAGRRRGVGAVVGRVYAVNTLGSIAGALLGGFVLVPIVGTRATVLALGGLAAAVGIAVGARREAQRPTWATAATVACVTALAFAAVALPGWSQTLLHLAVFESGRYSGDFSQLEVSDSGQRVLFHREGRSSSVLVVEYEDDGTRTMRIDARTNASDGSGDMPTQILLAQIPLLLAPRPENVFIVGWGSGVTVGAALQAPSVRSVTAVELEPAVVEGASFFDRANHRPLEDARVALLEDDARHVLLASDATYDVIVSEPPHPFVVGVANLFTRDFYALASRRLRDDGVFAQWVQTYELSLETYRSIVATFLSAFPHATLFFSGSGGDTILVGSRRPLALDPARLAARWQDPATRAELLRARLERPEHLLALAVLATEGLERFAAGAPLNTDDNMLVEFQAAAGSLVSHRLRPEVDRAPSRLDEILAPDVAAALLADPDRRAAYADGLRRARRDEQLALATEPPAAPSPR